MLKSLHFENLGPWGAQADLIFAPRLNVITGDNGLGKSFILDTAWTLLTGASGESPVEPPSVGEHAEAKASYDGLRTMNEVEGGNLGTQFDLPGLFYSASGSKAPVVYALAGGGVSVYMPSRALPPDQAGLADVGAVQLNENQLFEGRKQGSDWLCNGLIRDWVQWEVAKPARFRMLVAMLERLSSPDLPLKLGAPRRPFGADTRDHPTLLLHGRADVPAQWPSSVRRIAGLAYALVWAWAEDRENMDMLGGQSARELIVLLDEPEMHLHPKWQRRIVPALHHAASEGLESGGLRAQFVLTTHSPLVLASLESFFDHDQDQWFDIDLETIDGRGTAVVRTRDFDRQGDVSSWLESDAFDLRVPRSEEAEAAVLAARSLMSATRKPLVKRIREVEALLERHIPIEDDLWPTWRFYKSRWGA